MLLFNVVDITVIVILSLLFFPILITLIIKTRKNPCGGCAHNKSGSCGTCKAFSKANIMKAYNKSIKEEKKNMSQ